MKKNSINVDLRIIVIALLVCIAGMLAVWRPWQSTSKRTIDISGEATIKAEPDSYVFSPSYQKKGTDRTAIQTELIALVNGVIAKLKELGVADSDIVLSSSTYDNYWNDGTSEITSNSLTVTIEDKELVQKIQDYLVTTSPQGQITPYGTFTTDKRKSLEAEARIAALKDARTKATTTASELGLKIGKVVSVSDPQSGIVFPMTHEGKSAGAAYDALGSSVTSSLPVLGGKQDVSYTIQVTYELR